MRHTHRAHRSTTHKVRAHHTVHRAHHTMHRTHTTHAHRPARVKVRTDPVHRAKSVRVSHTHKLHRPHKLKKLAEQYRLFGG